MTCSRLQQPVEGTMGLGLETCGPGTTSRASDLIVSFKEIYEVLALDPVILNSKFYLFKRTLLLPKTHPLTFDSVV